MFTRNKLGALKIRKVSLCVIVFVISLLQPMGVVYSPLAKDMDIHTNVTPMRIDKTTLANGGQPGSLLTNIMNNPSFERRNVYGTPLDYNYYGSSKGGVNVTYQDQTYSGIYASRIWGQGSSASGSYSSQTQYFSDAYLIENLELNFYWFIEEPGSIDQNSYCFLYVQTVNSSSYWQEIYYVFSHGSWKPNNYSNGVYYYMNYTIGQWHHFNRNVTEDYLAYPQFIFDSSRRITRIDFNIYVQRNIRVETSWVIDDVSLRNGTAHEYVRNGDFESGYQGYWNHYFSSPAEIMTSTDSTDGQYSLNMSSRSIGYGAYGDATFYESKSYPWESYYPNQPNSLIIEYDWKYSDTWNSGNPNAYFRVRMSNDTGTFYWYHYLGQDLDDFSGTNSSHYIYTKAKAFGSRETWEHTYLDVYQGLLENNWIDLAVVEFGFSIYVGYEANSSIQLLIDDFQVKTYVTGDPSFEVTNWDTGSNPIGTWPHWTGGSATNQRTTDAHSGSYAVNLTVIDGQYGGIYREDFWTTMEPAMTTDFWWKINSISYGTTGVFYFRFRMEFDWQYEVYIYTARSSNHNPSNSTYNVHVFTEDVNTTGVWMNLRTNLSALLEEAFGPGLYNMTRLVLDVYAGSGENISIICDDIGFADAGPPEISSVSTDPPDPMYYESVVVSLTATDIPAGVYMVEVYYRTTGAWTRVETNRIGSTYAATIPAQPYGTTVEYYINATDWTGQIGIDDNGGSYYSYTVGDDVFPTVSFDSPPTGYMITGSILLEASADDIGSGIDFVEFQVDGESIVNDSIAPYEFMWNSRTVQNGSRVVSAIAHDVAGLQVTDSITLDIQNDVAPPILSEVVINPTIPQYGMDVTVSVAATDITGIENVTIFYRMDEGSWTSDEMTSSGALYTYRIPSAEWNTNVEFYIVAYDVFGIAEMLGSEVSPLGYDVGDNVLPLLGISGPSSVDPVRNTVQFFVIATDEGSGVSAIDFMIEGTVISTITGSGIISWNTLEYENGNYTLTFTARDNAGNVASFSIEYQVSNPVGLEGISDTLSEVMSQYGFFIGAAAMFALYGCGTLLMRRRAAASVAKKESKKSTGKSATKKASKSKKKS